MKIIGISGRKQAGKNTVANFINGSILKQKGMIQDYYINEDGLLTIQTNDSLGKIAYGIFDVTRKDNEFIEYAEKELWPYIKVYHFADPLKEMAINLFNIDAHLVYGSNNDKNHKTNIKWVDIPSGKNIDEYMTVREFLEYFGTTIIRKIYNNAWANFTINRVKLEQPEIAVIPDVRFPNEVKAIRDAGGIVIRLTRNIYESDAEAESALDETQYDWNNFDLVIDNSSFSLDELCQTLQKFNRYWI